MKPLSDYEHKVDSLRDNCPVRAAIDVIRGRWKPSILCELRGGTKRFSDLQAALGASQFFENWNGEDGSRGE